MNNPPCLILAGGFGTRLRSVVSDVPKPLAPVASKPFLFWLLQNLARQGVQEALLSLHHQAELVEQTVRSIDLPLHVRFVVESEPLGTGGAVAYAVQAEKLSGSFLVINGDTWLDDWVLTLLSMPTPTVGLVHVDDASRYGLVDCVGREVQKFREKQDHAGAGWINAGVYHLHTSDFQRWDGEAFSLERELLPLWTRQKKLTACQLQTNFIDIGIPDDYRRFCDWYEGSAG